MSKCVNSISFGHSIPFQNPHAVSVSLPLIQNVIDYEEGVTNGFSGSSSDAYNKIVKPVLKEWASDSRMVNTSGTTDDKGNNKNQNPPQNGYYDQNHNLF